MIQSSHANQDGDLKLVQQRKTLEQGHKSSESSESYWFLNFPSTKTCEHLVPFSSWFMPSASSKHVSIPQHASAERESGDAAPGMQKMMQEVQTTLALQLTFVMSHVPVSFNLVHRTKNTSMKYYCRCCRKFSHVQSVFLITFYLVYIS